MRTVLGSTTSETSEAEKVTVRNFYLEYRTTITVESKQLVELLNRFNAIMQ